MLNLHARPLSSRHVKLHTAAGGVGAGGGAGPPVGACGVGVGTPGMGGSSPVGSKGSNWEGIAIDGRVKNPVPLHAGIPPVPMIKGFRVRVPVGRGGSNPKP
jgi:hypothetical protein